MLPALQPPRSGLRRIPDPTDRSDPPLTGRTANRPGAPPGRPRSVPLLRPRPAASNLPNPSSAISCKLVVRSSRHVHRGGPVRGPPGSETGDRSRSASSIRSTRGPVRNACAVASSARRRPARRATAAQMRLGPSPASRRRPLDPTRSSRRGPAPARQAGASTLKASCRPKVSAGTSAKLSSRTVCSRSSSTPALPKSAGRAQDHAATASSIRAPAPAAPEVGEQDRQRVRRRPGDPVPRVDLRVDVHVDTSGSGASPSRRPPGR